jgi:ABC-type phosphate transport system permease subunit
VTALLLGCAEAAGSVAIILFLARTGEYGMGPLSEVTSLSYYIFDCQYGGKLFRELNGSHMFSAALILLIMTMGLAIGALVLKQRFVKRYRGA